MIQEQRMHNYTTDEEAGSVEADGGPFDGDTPMLSTYIDDEYGYSLAYPAEWSIKRDPDGGTTFEASRSTTGATVFVERSGLAPEASAAAFLAELAADEHVHALEVLAQRDTRLKSGQTGRVVVCAYVSDSCDRWRLSYLFARMDGIGYTLGIDWNDTAECDATATAMVESFALGAS